MQNTQNGTIHSTPNTSSIVRRIREFALIRRDPVLFMSLLLAGIFIFVFIVFPLYRSVSGGFISKEGAFDVTYFARYFDNYYGPNLRKAFFDTMLMGVLTAALGTLLGFVFAYAVVRCNIPGKRVVHWLALVPTVSPPFALALSMILLFGRNGLITNKVFGITFVQGMNDVYGLDGLVIVQSITFFSVSYLILRAMLERLNPAMEEAASSLGAGRFHLFRTITLPLLIPGIAASFLLLFVESLADLGNPLFLSGGRTVLSAQIFLAVIGEYNYQKASALSFVLMIPTLVIFLIQRYYVNRRTYISVTGKPAGSVILEKDPIIRLIFNFLTYAIIAFILLLYATIVYGSFSTAWGVDFTPTLRHWEMTVTRGIEAILDTTFLSALATPFAAILGMIIAWLVVRKNFTGKSVLDFTSNLGGAVPGTILGIGFVMAFNKPPLALAIGIYAVMALFFASVVGKTRWEGIIILGVGTAVGVVLNQVYEPYMYYILGGFYLVVAIYMMVTQKIFRKPLVLAVLGIYVMSTNWAVLISKPIANFSRSLERGFWSNAIFQASDHIKVLVQPTPALLAIGLVFAGVLLLQNINGKTSRIGIGILTLAVPCALSFVGVPYAMVGGAYIIMGAFIVRSVPASVRSGVAALQQIDPSIEEASNILGADAQYTFRKVTLPLILPALFAGLVFSFTRHMTSVSAIIFLISAKWRIVTASILSEWEQGGVSIAAAYSTVIIIFVLIAIFVLNLLVNKLFKGRGSVDMSQGF
ncbi:MAG: iron ABC transporter permease [Anaerolineaceae bacterium]|jgi:iron(III) transport system permease protein|nr:iron ABC transporter permease [Anaerolineaceae bacterium]